MFKRAAKFNWVLEPSKFLSTEEANRLLETAKDGAKVALAKGQKTPVRDYLITDLALSTGLRVMEIAQLDCGDVFIRDGISSLLVRNGKCGKRRREYQLKKLTPDHRILYKILQYQGEILSSDLHQLYLLECSRMKRRPIAERTFSEYVNDLQRAGLARIERARVRGKVRLIKTVK